MILVKDKDGDLRMVNADHVTKVDAVRAAREGENGRPEKSTVHLHTVDGMTDSLRFGDEKEYERAVETLRRKVWKVAEL